MCLLKTSARMQNEFAAVAQMAEGQFLKDGLTLNGGVSELPSGNSKGNNGIFLLLFFLLPSSS
jgi:hypothetical protein